MNGSDIVHEYTRNPVLSNPTSYMRFNQYLQKTWPENATRRGSAVIRATLYARIVACLKAKKCRKTFQKWVKANKFFLLEYPYKGAPNSVAYLGVPSGRTSSKTGAQPFKLVAKVEEFVYIIGQYHNQDTRHPGIRRTYAKLQKDFSYVPRAAVSKFVELCDHCTHRVSKVRLRLYTRLGRNERATEGEEEDSAHSSTNKSNGATSRASRKAEDHTESALITFNQIKKLHPILLRANEEETYDYSDGPLDIQLIDTDPVFVPPEAEEDILEFRSCEDILHLFSELTKDLILP